MSGPAHLDEAATILAARIRDIPDFPAAGVTFKDITPILSDGPSFHLAVEQMTAPWRDSGVTKILGIEARGFVLGAPVADRLSAGFVPLRKSGKLPAAVHGVDYALEYGTARMEAHVDSVVAGERVVIIDDVLATGGTAAAAVTVAELLGAEVVGLGFLMELTFLGGRAAIPGRDVHAVMSY